MILVRFVVEPGHCGIGQASGEFSVALASVESCLPAPVLLVLFGVGVFAVADYVAIFAVDGHLVARGLGVDGAVGIGKDALLAAGMSLADGVDVVEWLAAVLQRVRLVVLGDAVAAIVVEVVVEVGDVARGQLRRDHVFAHAVRSRVPGGAHGADGPVVVVIVDAARLVVVD